jgi:hypothetical protein
VGEGQLETELVVLPLLMRSESRLGQKVESDLNFHENAK